VVAAYPRLSLPKPGQLLRNNATRRTSHSCCALFVLFRRHQAGEHQSILSICRCVHTEQAHGKARTSTSQLAVVVSASNLCADTCLDEEFWQHANAVHGIPPCEPRKTLGKRRTRGDRDEDTTDN
jgi:hypothetical protein